MKQKSLKVDLLTFNARIPMGLIEITRNIYPGEHYLKLKVGYWYYRLNFVKEAVSKITV